MDDDTEITRKISSFSCEACSVAFPTKWQLERHNRTEAHHRVARASQQHNNNDVVAPKTDLLPHHVAPMTITPTVVPELAGAYSPQLRTSPRKVLLYSILTIILLGILDNLSTRRDETITTVKLGSMNLTIPASIAALLGYLVLSKMTRAEIKGWLDIGQGINKFFSNWSRN